MEPEKVVYTSFEEKNNLGGLKHRKYKRKCVEHYASETCPERCVVELYLRNTRRSAQSQQSQWHFLFKTKSTSEVTTFQIKVRGQSYILVIEKSYSIYVETVGCRTYFNFDDD